MEHQKSGQIGWAAMKAGMNRDTAAAYIHSGQLPSAQVGDRDWRTRPDPLEAIWPSAETMLSAAPELEAKALFEWLCDQQPGVYHEGQLRTFQRHVHQWRALHGPEQEVYFPQVHRPGVRMETDFTCMNSLEVTIGEVPFPHLLCHSVLTYSNWEWGTICHSESLLALRNGLQATLVQLGHIPAQQWTDHSTAATHELGGDERGQRGFNHGYMKLMDHFGIEPHTINRAEPHENGDIESANGAFKRRTTQYLLLRGNRNFANHDTYRQFLEGVMHKANDRRRPRLTEELATMRPLQVALLPEYVEEQAAVSRWSTIQIDRRMYSVPSRLIGETVRVRRYEERLDVRLGGLLQLSMPRLTGTQTHAINYRHVIEWLVRKPGAFAQYRFREDLFPSLAFRHAYDRLCAACSPRVADVEYLRILRQAARTMECMVEAVLADLEGRQVVPRWATLLEFWPVPEPAAAPTLRPLVVALADYDQLLAGTAVAS
jgi:hypothetical protein